MPAWRPERVFLGLAGPLGLFFIVLTPPFQVADEPAHFLRAYQVSEGTLVGSRQGPAAGGPIPASLPAIVSRVGTDRIVFHPDIRQSLDDMRAGFRIPLEPDRRIFAHFGNTVLYGPVAYLPQALGIGVGRLLGLAPLWFVYLGRVANLAVWLALGYWTLRITPLAEWGMFLLFLMPMTLFQAASLSADAPTNGLAALLTAQCARVALAMTGPVTGGVWALVAGLSLAVTLVKPSFALLAALPLLVPPRRFGGPGRYLGHMAAILLPVLLLGVVWLWLVRDLVVPLNAARPDPPAQLALILAKPARFAMVLVNTLIGQWHTWTMGFVGVLGWLDAPLPEWLVWSYMGTLAAGVVASTRLAARPRLWQRGLVLGVWLASAGAIILLNYLVWTAVGSDVARGIQGRHLIAAAPLLYVGLWDPALQWRSRAWAVVGPVAAATAGLVTVSVLLHRYWL
jgi:uncharacterized membrane protein